MPRLGSTDDMQQGQIGGSGFNFSGTRIDHLTATEYTLVTIAVDLTSSVSSFATQLRNMLIAAVEGCKKSPRSDNILVRVITFSSRFNKGVDEIHGFMPLADIDTSQYPQLQPGGMTPLNDAVFSSVGATNSYAKQLTDRDYNVNGILFIITDGGENASTATQKMVKDEINATMTSEKLESLISILIGVNSDQLGQTLVDYQTQTGLTSYIPAGEATAQRLAKLADFVSQSISSQSQALGTGGPSQGIAATI